LESAEQQSDVVINHVLKNCHKKPGIYTLPFEKFSTLEFGDFLRRNDRIVFITTDFEQMKCNLSNMKEGMMIWMDSEAGGLNGSLREKPLPIMKVESYNLHLMSGLLQEPPYMWKALRFLTDARNIVVYGNYMMRVTRFLCYRYCLHACSSLHTRLHVCLGDCAICDDAGVVRVCESVGVFATMLVWCVCVRVWGCVSVGVRVRVCVCV